MSSPGRSCRPIIGRDSGRTLTPGFEVFARRLNTARGSAHRMSEMAISRGHGGRVGVAVPSRLAAVLSVQPPRSSATTRQGEMPCKKRSHKRSGRERVSRREAALEAWVWRIVINEALALRRRRAPESRSVDEQRDARRRRTSSPSRTTWCVPGWPLSRSASAWRSFSVTSLISTTGRSRRHSTSRSARFRPRSPRRTRRFGVHPRRQCDE